MKPMNKKEFVAMLQKNGWDLTRNNGKHDIYTHESGLHISVPRSIEISVGLIRKETPKLLLAQEYNKRG